MKDFSAMSGPTQTSVTLGEPHQAHESQSLREMRTSCGAVPGKLTNGIAMSACRPARLARRRPAPGSLEKICGPPPHWIGGCGPPPHSFRGCGPPPYWIGGCGPQTRTRRVPLWDRGGFSASWCWSDRGTERARGDSGRSGRGTGHAARGRREGVLRGDAGRACCEGTPGGRAARGRREGTLRGDAGRSGREGTLRGDAGRDGREAGRARNGTGARRAPCEGTGDRRGRSAAGLCDGEAGAGDVQVAREAVAGGWEANMLAV
jgi:hypothetical protein